MFALFSGEMIRRGEGALPCVSPPSPQARVIQTKSTQRLSFSLTIATLLTSASWTLYGFRLRDPYIMVRGAGAGDRHARRGKSAPLLTPALVISGAQRARNPH